MPSRERSASRFRGCSVAGFTALLAVTAHGMASGKFPTGGTAALLVVLAAGMGAMVSASDRTAGPWPLLGVLALGQLGSHLVLSSCGHPVPERDRPPGSRRPSCSWRMSWRWRSVRFWLRRASGSTRHCPRRSVATAGSPSLSRRSCPRSRHDGPTIHNAASCSSPRRYRTEVPRPASHADRLTSIPLRYKEVRRCHTIA